MNIFSGADILAPCHLCLWSSISSWVGNLRLQRGHWNLPAAALNISSLRPRPVEMRCGP